MVAHLSTGTEQHIEVDWLPERWFGKGGGGREARAWVATVNGWASPAS